MGDNLKVKSFNLDIEMKKYLAEFIGTFWLVLGGCGSAVLAAVFVGKAKSVVDGADFNIDLGISFVGVALAFGLTVLTLAYAFGHISGDILIPPFPSVSGQVNASPVRNYFPTSSLRF